MPEIKRAFSASRMNKDLDERLVPAGEYRDANNIEIDTSEDTNIGTVQALKGNTALTAKFPAGSICVGSITDDKNDKIYWLVAGASVTSNNVTITKDYIAEYDIQNATFKYVLVDIYEVKIKAEGPSTAANGFLYAPEISSIDSYNNIGIRLDMKVTSTNVTTDDNIYVTDIQTDTNKWKILTSTGFATSDDEDITFTSERLLNFYGGEILNGKHLPPRLITGINVLDGMLFWTDNFSEPKKINIERCIAGTGGTQYLQGGSVSGFASTTTTTTHQIFEGDTDHFHTRLVSSKNGFDLEVMTDRLKQKAVWLDEEHITVLRKAPHTPPYLEMSSTDVLRTDASGNTLNISTTATNLAFTDSNNDLLTSGSTVYTGSDAITFDTNVDFRVGDIVILTNNPNANTATFTEHEVRIRIESAPSSLPPNDGPYDWSLLSIDSTISTGQQNWSARLEQSKPLFEFKFPRFAYRYKYKDGEYSTFSPFSEIAFLPSDFDYAPKKGFNLGMTNELRSLKIKDYVVEDAARGRDVVEVDILYKEDGSPNIYTVKSIKISDDHPKWPDKANHAYARGEFEIESELIHATLPSNQLLRPWDNVPRLAKSQEVTANRLVYGNYIQNYNMEINNEELIPLIDVGLESTVGDGTVSPSKSVKSIRTYQVGVVYRDKYGRETPVFPGDPQKSAIKIEKKECAKFNKLTAKMLTPPPSWADSWKFFVKETSNEYYNLAQDRWYNAEDGNIWLSFPSSERNKVDEDTFLILKKQHENNIAVTEKARYKILAIENEAPDFIKTNTKILGKQLSTTNNWVTSTTAGFPFIDYTNFTMQVAANFYAEFGAGGALDDAVTKAMHDGYLFIRISTDTVKGKFYKIANIKEVNSNIKIEIDGKFGDDMRFAAPAQTTGSIVSGLFVELATRIPENKPEFDGRFFVKIYKDLVLKENVLSQTSFDGYKVINAMSSYYINYQGFNENQHGSTNQLINALNNPGSDTTYIITPKGHSAADVNSMGSSIGLPLKKAVKNWWRAWGAGWFIDSAITANEGSLTENIQNNNIGTAAPADNALDGSGTGRIESGQYGIFDATSSNNTQGIVGTNKNIALSWSGIYPTGTSLETVPPGGNPPNNHVGGNPVYSVGTGAHAQQALVVQYLSTPGTQFRFKDDPDGFVYTIKDSQRTEDLLNYDSQDSILPADSFPEAANKRLRLTLTVENQNGNGIGVDGVQYSPITTGANPVWSPASSTSPVVIEFVEEFDEDDTQESSSNPGIWETEPKEDVGLDIYYESTQAYPIKLNARTNEQYAVIGSVVENENTSFGTTLTVASWSDQTVTLSAQIPTAIAVGDIISFTAPDGGVTRLVVKTAVTAATSSQIEFYNHTFGPPSQTLPGYSPCYQKVTLPFFNCYSFQNGVESNRIRDDFNAMTIDKGVKVSTVFAQHYEEERLGSGLIHSGIYNSTNGINNLNQFIAAEKITKNLNPRYGAIQKLYNRDTNLITICEDKVFNILADKDALYNADGSAQLVTSNKVLGQTTPYGGDYGTQNPESFVSDNYRSYFTDRIRGAVLRLSMNGITPISKAGMSDWFNDNLKGSTDSSYKNSVESIIGTFDSKKGLYNVTIKQIQETIKGVSFESKDPTYYTVSYSEQAKGWVSFKSFYPESGISINNNYYTFKDGELYKHHDNSTYNNFYGVQYYSDITAILNDQPGSIKSFNTINYEGSQAKIDQYTGADGEYYNLTASKGWYVDSISTDQQTGVVPEFIEKEGKWFNYIRGESTTLSNLDQKEFSVQGIGVASSISGSGETNTHTFTISNNDESSSGTTWDSTPD